MKRYLKSHLPWILLPGVLLGLLWLFAALTATSGQAPPSYAIM